ncbi:hypothetical protein [Streptomyces sp. NPDC058612]|uniref:hypothetical protein n=1 Tax=Streptomyces sp. NPDC058612 TaxID=3346555 RepID=UPI00364853DA
MGVSAAHRRRGDHRKPVHAPLPEPVADLMRAYMQSREHLPYASSRHSGSSPAVSLDSR